MLAAASPAHPGGSPRRAEVFLIIHQRPRRSHGFQRSGRSLTVRIGSRSAIATTSPAEEDTIADVTARALDGAWNLALQVTGSHTLFCLCCLSRIEHELSI